MNVVVAPDSFKGSLTAPQACAAMARGLQRVWPDAIVQWRPMADGGEGTLDAVLQASPGAMRETLAVPGAGSATVTAQYGVIREAGKEIAIVEAAQVVGITDGAAMQVDVGARSTTGVGMLIGALLDRGVRDFRIGIGGSSTNDGGAGLLAALGLRLFDAGGKPVAPTPDGLRHLARVDAGSLDGRLRDARIAVLSDVNNPLCGPLGASAVFGPQKGVDAARVPVFDAALARFAALAEAACQRAVAASPGAGAAGGLGFALQLIGAAMSSGAAVVADLVRLDDALADADWALTGEGRSDRQTLLDKAPFVVAQRAAARGVPVTLVSGAVDPEALTELGGVFAGCFGLPPGPATLDQCVASADPWLADRVEQAARAFAAGQR
jgi:glycerate kinase